MNFQHWTKAFALALLTTSMSGMAPAYSQDHGGGPGGGHGGAGQQVHGGGGAQQPHGGGGQQVHGSGGQQAHRDGGDHGRVPTGGFGGERRGGYNGRGNGGGFIGGLALGAILGNYAGRPYYCRNHHHWRWSNRQQRYVYYYRGGYC